MLSIAERAATLTQQRQPFVHATVVRAQQPTSARPGDAAVILSDGSLEGFVGGHCAEGTVRAAALDTLRDGSTLLLRVLPSASDDFPEAPGARVVVNPCHSGGAIEIFLRPVLPARVVTVAGSSPIAAAVRELALFLEWEVGSAYSGASAAVVASLGSDDHAAVRAALDAEVGHVALVASRRRGSALVEELGLTAGERARVHFPAGLDIGARTPQEIALSIMASLVGVPRVAAVAAPRTAVDPVCGMTVTVGPDAVVAGDHYFCCTGCRDAYAAR
ncbi:XdhC family protein [Symbioplanes lichenis]|uniref:XdhC family protein n=1 Tax=Symbioplanes lichenis TaxID=1629072 RepID=UPI0027392ABE|nr:XdhC family protein [Actinoplanes lichenis]